MSSVITDWNELFLFLFVERTDFTDKIATMTSMILLTILFVFFSKRRGNILSFFPKRFHGFYIVSTVISLGLLISTPFVTKDMTLATIVLLFYSSIVTPVFEELIFRGYVWNNLEVIFHKNYMNYIISTLIFALWHLGYVDSIAFRVHSDLANAMMWKVITGLCFGIILGLVRLKTKNCY